MKVKRLFASLARSRAGTSAVEFALFAPILALFVTGIYDLARGLTRKFEIEQASYRALELVTVGSTLSDYQVYIKDEAIAASGEPEANVRVEAWKECENEKQADINSSCTGTQEVARFVTVAIDSYFEPTFSYGPLGAALAQDADGKIKITAQSTIRMQ